MTGEPDISIQHAAKRGDRAAMHALLKPWDDAVFGFLLASLRHRADAEDAAQETFVRIVKGLPAYEHRGVFRAWVFRIARNQAALTAGRRQRVTGREIGVEPEALRAMPEFAEGRDDVEAAERAVAALPAVEREVVELRLNEDLKFSEVAERTGAPLNTVLGRRHNAIRRLHETLGTSLA